MHTLARVIPVAATFVLLSGCVWVGGEWAGGEAYKEDIHRTFSLPPGGVVSVENSNGSIEVIGWDQDIVEVDGTKYAATQDLLDSLRVEMNGSPMSVRVRTVRPNEIWHGNVGARYSLRVPKKVLLDRITNSNGRIQVENVDGNANLRSSNGPIRVSKLTGDLQAETSNGRIEVRDLDGNANLYTSNGAIDADAKHGGFEAHTSNGRIEARLIDPGLVRLVRLESSNGHIELRLEGGAIPEVRAHTSNSSMVLYLPAAANARVHARTTRGSVTSEFDQLRAAGMRVPRDLSGTIGTGGPLIDLDSTNGSIRILRQ
jgi:hypothetical protein